MTWIFPTLVSEGRQPHTRLRCGCGRTTRADMFTDLTGLSEETRLAWKVPVGASAICDACRETILREGRAKLEDICAALGAPKETVDLIEAKSHVIGVASGPQQKT